MWLSLLLCVLILWEKRLLLDFQCSNIKAAWKLDFNMWNYLVSREFNAPKDQIHVFEEVDMPLITNEQAQLVA